MNSKRIRFSPKFVNDLKDVLAHYDEISEVIGRKARVEIQSRLDLVAGTSEGFA